MSSDSKSKKVSVKEHFDQIKANAVVTVEKYQGSLARLRAIKLHKCLARTPGQSLAEVYHDFAKMEKWRRNCDSLTGSIERRIGGVFETLKRLKEDIVVRNGAVKAFVKAFDAFETESEGAFRKLNAELEKFVDDFFATYLDLRRKTAQALENTKESFLLLNNSALYKNKLKSFRQAFETKLKEVFLTACRNAVATFEVFQKNRVKIGENRTAVKGFHEDLERVNAELESVRSHESEKLERDYAYLLKPLLFPTAYASFLREIARRKRSFGSLKQVIDCVSEFVSKDNECRKDFLARFGSVLPDSFKTLMPSLKETMSCKVLVSLEENEQLPVLDDLEGYLAECGFNEGAKAQLENGEESLQKVSKVRQLSRECQCACAGAYGVGDRPSSVRDCDEKRLMADISAENVREELECYKSVFRSVERSLVGVSIGHLRKTAIESEAELKRALGELLVENSRVVVVNLEKVIAKRTVGLQRGVESQEGKGVEGRVEELETRNEQMAAENSANAQLIEGMKTDMRKLELILEEKEAELAQAKASMEDATMKLKQQVNELKGRLTDTLVDLKQEVKSAFVKVHSAVLKLVDEGRLREAKLWRQRLDEMRLQNHELSIALKDQQLLVAMKDEQLTGAVQQQESNSQNNKNKSFENLDCLIFKTNFAKNVENQSFLVLFVPFEKGKYVPLIFEDGFADFEKSEGGTKTAPIETFAEFNGLSGVKRTIVEENAFLVIGLVESEALKQSNQSGKMVVQRVVSVLSFDVDKRIWFDAIGL